MKQTLDISSEDYAILKSILLQHVPNIEVWAFGSRVTGTARKHSDLDLVLINQHPMDFDAYTELKKAFSDSTLAFKVDLVDWADLDENFKQIIKQGYVTIQKGQ